MNKIIYGRIYVHKNKINGKCYVGQSIRKNVKERWRRGKGYIESPHFYKAIKKYGWDNFEHIILPEIYSNHEDLNKAEIEMIAECNSYNNGYNLTLGGEGRNSSHSYKLSKEHKAKISAALKGKKKSAETRAKMSTAQKNRELSEEAKDNIRAAQLGRKMSEETKAKISATSKGRKISEETKAKMSAATKGFKHSDESKAKMRESWKKRKTKKLIKEK